VLGQSVASCSYHLGILGKYGYIELVPGQAGKEKPWRLASQQQNLDPADWIPRARWRQRPRPGRSSIMSSRG
jgi:hypothetical protein